MKKRYGMVIDLKRCIGCDACTIACRQVKASPRGILFAKLFKYERGKYPHARIGFLPVLCMHCNEPPCEEVCPTGATEKREDGIVTVDATKCIGCKYCIVACPYGARDAFRERLTYFTGQKTVYEATREKDHVTGTVEKCDFCLDRIVEGKEPACVVACPADARIFGNLHNRESRIVKLIAEKSAFQLNPQLGTDSSVYYLPDH